MAGFCTSVELLYVHHRFITNPQFPIKVVVVVLVISSTTVSNSFIFLRSVYYSTMYGHLRWPLAPQLKYTELSALHGYTRRVSLKVNINKESWATSMIYPLAYEDSSGTAVPFNVKTGKYLISWSLYEISVPFRLGPRCIPDIQADKNMHNSCRSRHHF